MKTTHDPEFLREFPEAYNVVDFPYRVRKLGRLHVSYEHIATGEVRVVPSYVARLEPPPVHRSPPGRRGLIHRVHPGVWILTAQALILIATLGPLFWLMSRLRP